MTRTARILLSTLAVMAGLMMACPDAHAQLFRRHRKEKAKTEQAATTEAPARKSASTKAEEPLEQKPVYKSKGGFMQYIIEDNGDTTFVGTIDPVWVFPRGVRRDAGWRKYYRLVYNFNKVYPYALFARDFIEKVDSDIENQELKRLAKDKYVSKVQGELLKAFEPVVRKMTTSQGRLLCRLVDREIGLSTYEILKDYKNGFTAGFWQGIGKLFGQDLKQHYDPEGEDKLTEELIKKWEAGQFDDLYYSIFMEWPKKSKLPSQYQ